jgi:hypothetical protein
MLPLFLFLALKDNIHLLSAKVFKNAVFIYLLIGLLQHFNLFSDIAQYLVKIIPDYRTESIGGGRGVAFLSHEPSASGQIIFLMMLTSFFFYFTNKISKNNIYVLILVFLLMLLINKSGTLFFLILIYLIVYLSIFFADGSISRKVCIIFSIVAISPIIIILAKYFGKVYMEEVRFVLLLNRFFQFLWSESLFSYQNLILFGGKRFLTVCVGYVSLFDQYGFGHGVASYLLDFNRLSEFARVFWLQYMALGDERYIEVLKPDSYGAQISMDSGILGLSILILLVIKIWQKDSAFHFPGNINMQRGENSYRSALFLTALFMIFFRSTTTLPVPWVMLAYVYFLGRYRTFHRKNDNKNDSIKQAAMKRRKIAYISHREKHTNR